MRDGYASGGTPSVSAQARSQLPQRRSLLVAAAGCLLLCGLFRTPAGDAPEASLSEGGGIRQSLIPVGAQPVPYRNKGSDPKASSSGGGGFAVRRRRREFSTGNGEKGELGDWMRLFWSCVSCFTNPGGFAKGAWGVRLRARSRGAAPVPCQGLTPPLDPRKGHCPLTLFRVAAVRLTFAGNSLIIGIKSASILRIQPKRWPFLHGSLPG